MSSAQLDLVLKHIRRVSGAPGTGQCSDRRLVEDFLRSRDETAFTELVRRHGPMVLNVCRSVLHQEQDAEDAFQATFLVLARKADSIRQRETLAGWLWGVANNLARKAQAAAARQGRLATPLSPWGRGDGGEGAAPDHLLDMTVRELRSVLYEELQRLPEKYRLPLVLCYLEGRTQEEAAQQLGWSKGAVRGRLNRGREKLRTRLAHRGLTLSAGVLTTALAVNPASAGLPGLLVDSTAKAALAFASGHAAASGIASATAVSLAVEAVKAMTVAKLKIAAIVWLAVGAAGLTVGAIAQQFSLHRPAGISAPAAPLPPLHKDQDNPGQRLARADNPPSPRPEKAKSDATKEVTVTGRVLGPDGKAVAGVQVAVLESPRQTSRPGQDTEKGQTLAQAKSGSDGEFQLILRRTLQRAYHIPKVVAVSPGFGLGWQSFDPSAARSEVVVRLQPELVLRGRLMDLQGQPAANVKLHVISVSSGEGYGVSEPVGVSSVWPGPLTTDPQGRFVLRGLGRDQDVTFQVRDDRFARQELRVPAGQKDRAKEITLSLSPPHVLSGRVTFADTGKPVARARLMVMASGGNFFGDADADGIYQIPLGDTKYVRVYAAPAKGQPYSTLKKHSDWPKGAVRHSLDLALPKGIPVKGKITESPSGNSVAWANIQYFPQQTNNPHLHPDVASLWPVAVDSGAGGEFEIVLPPGSAHLLITGPTPDYIHQEVAYSLLADGKLNYGRYSFAPEGNAYFGGQRVYAHAVVAVNLKPGSEPEPLAVRLRRGVTVRGRLVGLGDKPVARAWMLSRLNVSIWDHMVGFSVDVFDGRFELRGCDPKATYRVIFFDPTNQQGGVAEITGKQTEPVTVRLAPCGTAKARLVNEKGEPLGTKRPWIGLVVTPGGGHFQSKELHADMVDIANLDWVHYGNAPHTDAEGRLTLPALIPGATYRFDSPGWIRAPFKDCIMQGAKTVDWGDIVNPAVFDETQ